MAEETRKAWDQMEGEPDEAFLRFLTFLSLGPSRTLARAAESHRNAEGTTEAPGEAGETEAKGVRRRPPGCWYRDSVRFGWVARATQHDIATIAERCSESVVRFMAILSELGALVLDALREKAVAPKSFGDLLEAVSLLGAHMPAGAAEQLSREAQRLQLPAPEARP